MLKFQEGNSLLAEEKERFFSCNNHSAPSSCAWISLLPFFGDLCCCQWVSKRLLSFSLSSPTTSWSWNNKGIGRRVVMVMIMIKKKKKKREWVWLTSQIWETGRSTKGVSWLGVSMTTSWEPKAGRRHSPNTVPSPTAEPQGKSWDTAGNLLTMTRTRQSEAFGSPPSLTAKVSGPVPSSNPGQNAQGPCLTSSSLLLGVLLKSDGLLPLLSEMITHLCTSGSLLSSAILLPKFWTNFSSAKKLFFCYPIPKNWRWMYNNLVPKYRE